MINILLVDDQPGRLLSYEAILGELGENLVRAKSGTEALARLMEMEFAVILLDVNMPDMDGFETAAYIRKREASKHIPIIFLTANAADVDLIYRGYSVGAVDYLVKPLDPEIVKAKVAVFEGARTGSYAVMSDPEIPVQSAEELRGKKVLLVDDDARNLFAITSVLERRDIVVVSASTAQEGIEALAETPDIDLILMDIMLPGVDGFAATRQIRAMPAFAQMPIIALTAKAMPGDRERCLEAGCTAFVAKPVDLNRLVFTMKQVLGLGGGAAGTSTNGA